MRWSVHGLEVEVAGSLPASLLGELLGGFPEGEPSRPPDLVIGLEPAAGPPPEGGRPLFFHGGVRVRAVEGGLLVTDGSSTARVADGGRAIALAVAPASLVDPRGFEHLLALIALVLALRQRHLYHVHAAALVRGDGRAVLVAGGAGAGKTTLALALLEHGGLDALGDDAAFLAPDGAGVAVRALPRPFHVGDATAQAFPRLAALLAQDRREGKRSLDPRAAFPGRTRAAAGQPCAVVLPRIDPGGRTRLRAVEPAEALGALIGASALVAVDGLPRAQEHLAVLGRVVDRARCVEVALGTDLLEAPDEVVGALLGGFLGEALVGPSP